MHLTEALDLVDPKWAKDFVSFVETGEASDEFIAFLDTSEACQRAVDMVLEQESGKVARVAALLREPTSRPQSTPSFAHYGIAEPSAMIVEALGAALALPAEQRTEVIKEAVATMQNESRDRQAALQSMVSEMAQQVDVVR